MDRSVLEENLHFKMLGLSFSSKLAWGFYSISIAETASKEIGALIRVVWYGAGWDSHFGAQGNFDPSPYLVPIFCIFFHLKTYRKLMIS